MLAGILVVTGVVGSASAQDAPVMIADVYIEMDDGVRLAADIWLPPGTPSDGSVQVPCLVELTPYRKETRAAEGAGFLPQAGFG
ncbi:MAG TPA: CocE/NonD family hydrolase, partial [Nitriliruptorales bacterium]